MIKFILVKQEGALGVVAVVVVEVEVTLCDILLLEIALLIFKKGSLRVVAFGAM